MRTHFLMLSSLVVSLFSAPAVAAPAGSEASFLVEGVSARTVTAPIQTRQSSSTAAGGIGFGVKGGFLFSSFDQAGRDFSNNNGWAGGLFFGGNRQGALGVMGEVLYAKKGAKSGSTPVDLYYLEIPVLARLNIGSANRNTGAIVYALGGPVFDINLKAEQSNLDVKGNYESLDIGVIAGAGIEISRLLVEGRYNWGLRNVAKARGGAATDIKTRSFAILAGIRFN